ncbi:hypothetical protein niasHS_005962 [Heterodera schachtii]|uniref:Uncharacterized protein n=1 Tax=Heterodera schachtii TaxID=97005 RepID=A0ABD2JN14_HETSC
MQYYLQGSPSHAAPVLSAGEESNGTSIERHISAPSSGQQQIVMDNPKSNSRKVWESIGTNTAGNATAEVGSVVNGTADEAMSTTIDWSRVRKNTKQRKYEVRAILSTTTYRKDGQLRRSFYVHWLGLWLGLKQWMDTQELVTDFTVNSVISWIFKAIRGEEVPEEIAEKLRTNLEYIS